MNSRILAFTVLLTPMLAVDRPIMLFNGATVPAPPVLGAKEDTFTLNGKKVHLQIMHVPPQFISIMSNETRQALSCYLFKNPPPPPPPSTDGSFVFSGLPTGFSTFISDDLGKRVTMDPCGNLELSEGLTAEQALRMTMWMVTDNADAVSRYYERRETEIRNAIGGYLDAVGRRTATNVSFDWKTAQPDNTPAHQIALVQAYGLWRAALGRPLPIPIPKLYTVPAGACSAIDSAAACVRGPGKVFVEDLNDTDARTVMMHEIAHLLGVPHIEDDPLMNPHYKQKLEKPTEAAIALARIGRQ